MTTDIPSGTTRSGTPDDLVRLPDDRIWLGVAAAVARRTGTDPVLWRVAIIVLTVFGGSGLLLYVAGWALIRKADEPEAPAERWLRGRRGRGSVGTLLVIGVLVLIGVGLLGLLSPWDVDHGPGIAPLVVVGVLAYVVLHRSPALGTGPLHGPLHGPPPPPFTPFTPPPPTAPPTSYGPLSAGDVPPPAPRPRRAPVTTITVAATVAVVALLAGLSSAGVDGITVERTLAAALVTLGAGVLAGSFFGRQLRLITLTLLTAGGLTLAACVDVPWDASVGERTWTVTSEADLATRALGVGEGTLDLTGLVLTRDAEVHASVGIGHLVIDLPEGTRVRVLGSVSAGEYDVLDEDDGDTGGNDVSFDRTFGPGTGPTLTVDAEVGVGNLEVRG